METFEQDVTFIIPVRSGIYDTEERYNNCKYCLCYLHKIFNNPKLIVIEQGLKPTYWDLLKEYDNYKYILYRCEDKSIHKSKLINDASKLVDTEFFIMNDSDCVVNKDDYLLAYEYLIKGYDFVTTHNNDTIEVMGEYKEDVASNKWNFKDDKNLTHSRGGGEIGCIVSFNKKNFYKAGMYSEKFEGWGCEDLEISVRYKNLGFNIITKLKSDNHLVHLNHKATFLWGLNNPNYQSNLKEYHRIKDMKCIELLQEIQNWKWCQFK